MAPMNILIYPLRRDLRLQDNPILHEIAKCKHEFTHVLPVYIFPAQQVEVSGFIPKDPEGHTLQSPYPEARSANAGFWRCGVHRAKFLAESVWDLRHDLEKAGSGLEIRVGMVGEVVSKMLRGFAAADGEKDEVKVGGVWMTGDVGPEELIEQREVKEACEEAGVDFRLFVDEKYFIHDDDLPFENVEDTPDVFTTYKKMLDPLRDAPRPLLPTISLRDSGLPPLPPKSMIPEQHLPFVIPESYAELESALIAPLHEPEILNPPQMPPNTQSGHPFHGGATAGHARIKHLLESSAMSKYKDTRNGMLGLDYATKLSGWLSIGCISARQLHYAMRDFEDGVTDVGRDASGYGQGENRGTLAVRYELIWRDFMRLCSRKWGDKLFNVTGYIGDHSQEWTYMPKPHEAAKRRELERFLEGTTGMGLIDASQRELYLTGYTSNRARQNVASFLAKHLKFDWRIGAEWYECMLVDYDMSSNWGNWQYVSGVGCDPRGYRVFNPVKQAYDYDSKAEYVKAWVPELGGLETPGHCFQAWTTPPPLAAEQGLTHLEWVKEPLKKIKFIVGPGRHAGRHSGGSNGGGEQFRGQGARQRERQRAMELANHITVIPYRPRGVGSGGGEPHSPAGSSNSGHSFQDLQQIRGVHSGRGRQGSWDGTAAAIHSLGRSGSWDGSAAGYYGERQGSWDGSIGSNDGGRQGSWNGSIPVTGGDRGRGGFRGRGRAGEGSWRRGGGREARMGHMDRDAAARSPDGGVYF